MDEDKYTTLPDSQTHPDNAQDGLSMTDMELGLQLTVYSATSTLAGILSQAIGHDTQIPTVQSTGEVPYDQVPQEPSFQNTEEHLRLDVTHVLVEPITARPVDTTNSGDRYSPSSSTAPSSAADKDCHTITNSNRDEETGPSPDDTLKSLRIKLKLKWADPMDDIAYIHACSLANEALPKITNADSQLLHKEHIIQFRSLAQLVDYVDQSVEKLHIDVKTTSTSFTTASQVQSMEDQ